MRETLAEFSKLYASRPLMLGTVVEVNAMFFFFDNIDFILKHHKKMDFQKYSWWAFLIQSGHIKGSRNTLAEKLSEDPTDFTLLYQVRDDYRKWLESKLEQEMV